MHYLVLGASGFIGSAVVKALLAKDHVVTVIQHRTPVGISHPNLAIIQSSLKDCLPVLERQKPDVIIHLARISGGRYAIGRYIQSLRGKKFNNQVRAYLEKNPKVRLFYLSGSLMYGNSDQPITEKNPLNPISFARQYFIAEKPFVINPPVNCTVLRPGWVFGNGSWFKQFFLNPVMQSGYVPQYGNGTNIMSLIHVNDLAKLIVTYTEKAPLAPVYNLYSPVQTTLDTFAETLAKICGKELKKFSEAEVEQKYNATIREAFSSNIALASQYTELINTFDFEYQNLESLLLSEVK